MPDHDQTGEHPVSWAAAMGGAILFLFYGLFLILGEIPRDGAVPSWLFDLRNVLFVGCLVLPELGFGIGWVKGFPRWSYPYVGLTLLMSAIMMSAAFPNLQIFGYTSGHELWGWRAWIPFLAMVVIALLATRSLRPLGRLFTNIWEDWTLLTFAMFGCMPLLVGMSFDEVDQPYSLVLMLVLTSLMTGTALVYLQTARRWVRPLALLVGISVTAIVAAAAPRLYWSEYGWAGGILWAVQASTIVVVAMFSPALIGLLHRSSTTSRPATTSSRC
jgi:hypothetical protein